MLTRITSTPSDGATVWIATNWLTANPWLASRRTVTRVTPGAICLSSSSHFAPMLNSQDVNPVALPPGRARLSTKPAATASWTIANTIGTVRVACSKGACARMASGEGDIGRERGQFLRLSANCGDVGCGPADVD